MIISTLQPGNQGSSRWSNLPQITQQTGGRARIQAQAHQTFPFFPLAQQFPTFCIVGSPGELLKLPTPRAHPRNHNLLGKMQALGIFWSCPGDFHVQTRLGTTVLVPGSIFSCKDLPNKPSTTQAKNKMEQTEDWAERRWGDTPE